MSYEKNTWVTGDIVTAEKLNNIEDGIENAVELPEVTEDDNGKVLKVVNGVWAKGEGGSGTDNALVVYFRRETDESGTENFIFEKSISEIGEAAKTKIVLAIEKNGDTEIDNYSPYYLRKFVEAIGGHYYLEFQKIAMDEMDTFVRVTSDYLYGYNYDEDIWGLKSSDSSIIIPPPDTEEETTYNLKCVTGNGVPEFYWEEAIGGDDVVFTIDIVANPSDYENPFVYEMAINCTDEEAREKLLNGEIPKVIQTSAKIESSLADSMLYIDRLVASQQQGVYFYDLSETTFPFTPAEHMYGHLKVGHNDPISGEDTWDIFNGVVIKKSGGIFYDPAFESTYDVYYFGDDISVEKDESGNLTITLLTNDYGFTLFQDSGYNYSLFFSWDNSENIALCANPYTHYGTTYKNVKVLTPILIPAEEYGFKIKEVGFNSYEDTSAGYNGYAYWNGEEFEYSIHSL